MTSNFNEQPKSGNSSNNSKSVKNKFSDLFVLLRNSNVFNFVPGFKCTY